VLVCPGVDDETKIVDGDVCGDEVLVRDVTVDVAAVIGTSVCATVDGCLSTMAAIVGVLVVAENTFFLSLIKKIDISQYTCHAR
jgi:hypothetical protein